MNIKKLTLNSPGFPELLRHIPSKPKQLYVTGNLQGLLTMRRVAIVGSRLISPYGEQVTVEFAKQLAGQGIVIVSGLAYGVDAVAHKAALDAGGYCIAVLPGPLDNIVPVYNRRLADRILETGGALVSEYPPGDVPFRQNFVARNRLMAGLADAVLVTEAAAQSGTRHTVNFAFDQDRLVFAVPGNIYAPGSAGTHHFIKIDKAALVTDYKDIMAALGIEVHRTKPRKVRGSNPNEQILLDIMLQGVSAGDELLLKSDLPVQKFNQAMAMLEISGKIRPLGANYWAIT
jgi:DNA processing protein